MKKKEIITMKKLIPKESTNVNGKCNSFFNKISFCDAETYVKIKHPVIKNQIVYIKSYEMFILSGIQSEIESFVQTDGIYTDNIKNKINDYILLLHKIDADNNLQFKDYKVQIKNSIVYIL